MATAAIKIAATAMAILFANKALFSQPQFAGPHEGDYYFLEEIFTEVADADSATARFYAGLQALISSSPQDQERLKRLYADVVDVMIASERDVYKTLNSNSKQVEFFTHFWQDRDLTPATLANERLIEHYQRLPHARDNYKLSFDSRGYDDRGQIYVRFGPPDDNIISSSISSADPVESWVYHGLGKGRAVTFDFVFRGYAFFLTDRLVDAVKMATPSFIHEALLGIVRERIVLDPSYYRLYHKLENIPPGTDVRTAIERALGQYAAERHDKIFILPPAATSMFAAFKPLPFIVNLAHFKNSEGKFDLVAVIGLERSSIKAKKASSQFYLQLNAALKDSCFAMRARQTDSLMLVPSQFDAQGHFVSVWRYELPKC